MKVYLAHKFENQQAALLVQAELEAEGITVLNPFQREEQEKYDHTIAKEGGQFDDATCAEIVRADLALIDECDVVLAMLSPNAIGTVMEIFYAGHVRRIPVVTWVLYKIAYRHPWIAYYSHDVYNHEDFVKEALRLSTYHTINL